MSFLSLITFFYISSNEIKIAQSFFSSHMITLLSHAKINGCKNECRLKTPVHSPLSHIVMSEKERENTHIKILAKYIKIKKKYMFQ